MNRTTATIATVVSALACGIPSLVLICLSVMAIFGAQMPEVMAQNPNSTQQDVYLGSGVLLCFGFVLLLIPFIVGIFSFRLSKKEEPAGIDYIPPAS